MSSVAMETATMESTGTAKNDDLLATPTKKNSDTRTREFTGTIVQRRSLGRFLAFADIRTDHSNITVIPVVFRRHLMELCDIHTNFPIKKAALPYGARVQLTCLEKRNDDEAAVTKSNGLTKSATPWEVTRWKLLSNPHDAALQVATASDGDGRRGISCTDYLRSRRNAFDNVAASASTQSERVVERPARHKRRQHNRLVSDHNNLHGDGSHYSNKALRAKVFAAFLKEHLLNNGSSSSSEHRVLDVAGGKGQLSLELAIAAGVQCTVVDPVVRRRRKPNTNKKLLQQNKPVPQFVAEYFANNDELSEIVKSHTCLVGLHPDQCTEDILDVALQYNKSVAIVPCCVFPSLFPTRVLRESGRLVHTYDDFLQYLLQKDARLQQTVLPFDGKNRCIYYFKVNDD